jgi:hypothetical protein
MPPIGAGQSRTVPGKGSGASYENRKIPPDPIFPGTGYGATLKSTAREKLVPSVSTNA